MAKDLQLGARCGLEAMVRRRRARSASVWPPGPWRWSWQHHDHRWRLLQQGCSGGANAGGHGDGGVGRIWAQLGFVSRAVL